MNQVEITKKCSKCQEVKLIDEFYKDNTKLDKVTSYCKKCCIEKEKLFRKTNPELKRIRDKNYYLKYPNYYKISYKKNPKKFLDKNKRWKLKHPDYKNKHEQYRRSIDPNYKLLSNIRRCISLLLRDKSKSGHTLELLGCNINQFWIYLEKQFRDGMTKENYGKLWHIDHIIPISFFNLSDLTEQKQCCFYTNLQPLLVKENLSKGNKLINKNYNESVSFIN